MEGKTTSRKVAAQEKQEKQVNQVGLPRGVNRFQVELGQL